MTEPSTPVPAQPEWLTPLDVANRLGVSRTFVYQKLFAAYDRGESGGLRYKRLTERTSRVHVSWFHQFMESTRQGEGVA